MIYKNIVILLIFILSVSVANAAPPVDKVDRGTVAKEYAKLKSKAVKRGRVRLIVKPLGVDAVFLKKNDQAMQVLDRVKKQLAQFSGNRVHRVGETGYLSLEVNAKALDRLIDSGLVEHVYENSILKSNLSDSLSLIGANYVHSGGDLGAGQSIVILDSGVDTSHEVFAGRIDTEACFSWPEYNNAYEENLCPLVWFWDPAWGFKMGEGTDQGVHCSLPNCEHGTHVAGIAAAVAPAAKIIPVQVHTKFLTSDDCDGAAPCSRPTEHNELAALRWVLSVAEQYNIAAVNISSGSEALYYGSCDDVSPYTPLLDELRTQGVAVITSSGNDGSSNSVNMPGCESDAITVGSTELHADNGDIEYLIRLWWGGSFASKLVISGMRTDAVSHFSNTSSMLDMFAPGQAINSSLPGDSYGYKQGTSMAAPHVAGAMAVLKAKHSSASIAQLEELLEKNGESVYGSVFPRLDLTAAMSAPFVTFEKPHFSVMVGEPFEFGVLSAHNPLGNNLTYHMHFSDGAMATGQGVYSGTVEYTHDVVGQFNVSVSAASGSLSSNTSTAEITVYDPAVLSVIITSLLL